MRKDKKTKSAKRRNFSAKRRNKRHLKRRYLNFISWSFQIMSFFISAWPYFVFTRGIFSCLRMASLRRKRQNGTKPTTVQSYITTVGRRLFAYICSVIIILGTRRLCSAATRHLTSAAVSITKVYRSPGFIEPFI